MSDVEQGTEAISEDADFETHRKHVRANDEPAADESGDDFEGHRKNVRANEDPAADDSDSDFEGHMKAGRHG
jgi:hypothetical protein